ncbi:MAG: hypothetical protein AAFW89_12680 [Bacteroidota bacterium]
MTIPQKLAGAIGGLCIVAGIMILYFYSEHDNLEAVSGFFFGVGVAGLLIFFSGMKNKH